MNDKVNATRILPLGTYSKCLKTGSFGVICNSMFIAALFTIAKGERNQNIHHQINGYTKCDILHTIVYYLNIKKLRKSLSPAKT